MARSLARSLARLLAGWLACLLDSPRRFLSVFVCILCVIVPFRRLFEYLIACVVASLFLSVSVPLRVCLLLRIFGALFMFSSCFR